MKKVKFSVMCNAVYYGELIVENDLDENEILFKIRGSLNDVPVEDLEWISDLDTDSAVTPEDIISIEEI